jgi:hypothetical protein
MLFRFAISLLFLCSYLFAQVPTDTSKLLKKKITSIELINIGASMPISDFGNHEKSATSGFALPGIKLNMGYNIQLYKHLGIKSLLQFQNNQIDDYKYKKDLLAENPVNSYTISSGGWNNLSALLGAYANFNLGDSYHLQPYLLFGFNYGMSPTIDLTVSDSLKTLSTITQKRGHAIAFCYGAGLDMKADLTNNFQLTIGVNYFITDLKFEKIRVENSYKNSVYEFIVYQPIQTLGFKVGLAKTLR